MIVPHAIDSRHPCHGRGVFPGAVAGVCKKQLVLLDPLVKNAG